MKIITTRFLPTLLFFIIGFSVTTANSAERRTACQSANDDLNQLPQQIEQHQQALNILRPLVNEGHFSGDQPLAQIIGVPLDLEQSVRYALQEKTTQLQNASQSTTLDFSKCEELANDWKEISQTSQRLQTQRLRLELNLLQLKRAQRLLLVRGTNQWLQVMQVKERVNRSATPEDLRQQMLQWIAAWDETFVYWLAQVLTIEVDPANASKIWLTTLNLPSPTKHLNNIDAQPPSTDSGPVTESIESAETTATLNESENAQTEQDLPEFSTQESLMTLEDAHEALRLMVGKWRNRVIEEAGWGYFLNHSLDFSGFSRELIAEWTTLPSNLADGVSRPFVRAYKRAVQNQNVAGQTVEWFLQAAALLLVLSGLIRLAAATPKYLSNLQRSLLESLGHGPGARAAMATFQVFKPNAPWLTVWLGTSLFVALSRSDWTIFNWIGPLGMLYAGMRATRIALEWLLSRSFTRSRQYMAPQTAEKVAKDASFTSWIVVLIFCSHWLVKAQGGGFSAFLMPIVLVIVLWCVSFWLLNRFANNVARFLVTSVKGPVRSPQDIAPAMKLRVRFVWPALFVLAHLYDLLKLLNQRLMMFDSYRALTVKVLRMRLEAIDDERGEAEAEDNHSDTTYSTWFLQRAQADSIWIDAFDTTNVSAPIRDWLTHSDDNVMLIVGDQGSGKTTLAKRLVSTWKDSPIEYLAIPAKTTEPEKFIRLLGDALGLADCATIGELVTHQKGRPPSVIILDNAHNLFLTEVGMLDAYRMLVQCLNAHMENIFWIVVMHSASWTYLDCVFNREQHFSDIYRMRKWSPTDIRKLILARHQGSGRRLVYDELLLSATASSESTSVRAADSRVFNIIWEQSAGNPLVAMRLWLTAARSNENTVEIGVPQKPAASTLNELKDDLCFVFASIVCHKALNTEEIMLATNYSEPMVRHALKQGITLGLLTRTEDKRYVVEPVWQTVLTAYLTRKNMI